MIVFIAICKSEIISRGVLVHKFRRDDVDPGLIDAVIVNIGDVGHLPLVVSDGVDQVDSGWVLILDLDEVWLFLDGGDVCSGVELWEDDGVEGSDYGVDCIVVEDGGHVGVFEEENGLVDVETYPSDEVSVDVTQEEQAQVLIILGWALRGRGWRDLGDSLEAGMGC